MQLAATGTRIPPRPSARMLKLMGFKIVPFLTHTVLVKLSSGAECAIDEVRRVRER